jgi:hypothetical protein
MGPVFLHKLLTAGALFMTQAAGTAGWQAAVAGKLAFNAAQATGIGAGPGLYAAGPAAGERLAGSRPGDAAPMAWAARPESDAAAGPGASMASAAQSVDVSDGKGGSLM